jgi:hypothetical protein
MPDISAMASERAFYAPKAAINSLAASSKYYTTP